MKKLLGSVAFAALVVTSAQAQQYPVQPQPIPPFFALFAPFFAAVYPAPVQPRVENTPPLDVPNVLWWGTLPPHPILRDCVHVTFPQCDVIE